MIKSKSFKWNPFVMFGEAPASYRFKEEDDLEFASKEDLEAIGADPRLSKLHTSMKAGVTKKFQTFSETLKQLQAENVGLKQQVEELDSGLGEWEQWSEANKPTLLAFVEAQKKGGEVREKGGGREVDKGIESRIGRMEQTFNQERTAFKKEIGNLGRMLDFSLQLGELHRQYPNMDAKKVLEVMKNKGHRNLLDAYKDDDAYGKELFDGEVEKRLKPRLEEELTKRNTKIESGSPSFPIKFELPKDRPTSMLDAGKEFLEEKSKAENKLESSPLK